STICSTFSRSAYPKSTTSTIGRPKTKATSCRSRLMCTNSLRIMATSAFIRYVPPPAADPTRSGPPESRTATKLQHGPPPPGRRDRVPLIEESHGPERTIAPAPVGHLHRLPAHRGAQGGGRAGRFHADRRRHRDAGRPGGPLRRRATGVARPLEPPRGG